MAGEYKTTWTLDSNALGLLDQFADKADNLDDKFKGLKNTNPFPEFANDAGKVSQSLGGLVNNYDKVTEQVRYLNHEKKTLLAIQKDLIQKEKDYLLAGKYDEYTRQLAKVKDRLKELGVEQDKNTKGVEKHTKATDNAKKSVDKFGDALKAAFTLTGILFVIEKIAEIGTKIIEVTGLGEKYQNQFTRIFNGNGQAAQAYLNTLQTVADTTNFTFDTLADNAAKLASRGITPAKEGLLGIGDVANFINKDFTELNEAILDVNESERWKNLGFVVKTEGDKMTLSYGDFSKTVDKTVEGAYSAIQAFSQLGKVQGSTAEAGLTLSGRMNTLADTFIGFFRTIGQGNTGVLSLTIDSLDAILRGATELVKVLQPSFDSLGKVFSTVGGTIASLFKTLGNFNGAATSTGTVAQTLGYYLNKYIISPFSLTVNLAAQVVESLNTIVLAIQYVAARLSGDTSLSDAIDKQLDASNTRLEELRSSFGKTLDGMRQKYDDYVKDDEVRKRRDARRARLAEEELAKEMGKPKATKTETESEADKKKRIKAEQDVYNKLKDAAKQYEKDIEKLQVESRKNLLERFEKDSQQYLEAKKDSDLKEIQAEQDKLLQLKQLKTGTVSRNSKSGKLEITPNTKTQLNASEMKFFDDRRDTVNMNFEKDISKNILDQEREELELAAESDANLIALEKNKWQALLNEAKEGTVKYELTLSARKRAIAALQKSLFGDEAVKQLKKLDQEQTDKEVDTIKKLSQQRTDGLLSQKDYEKQLEEERIKQAISFAERRLQILKLSGNQTNDEVKKQIKDTEALIAGLKVEQNEAQKNAKKNRTFYDLLFEAAGTSKDTEEFAQRAEFYKGITSEMFGYFTELSQARIQVIDKEIDAKKNQLEKEYEAQRKGLANNAALREQELAKLQDDRKKELAAARAYQAAQQAIESLEQSASLITSAANIFKVSTKTLGPVGLAVGTIAIAGLLTLFKIFKNRAADATKQEFGEGGTLEGPSHKNGGIQWGNTNIYSEGGEEIIRANIARRDRKLLKLINADKLRHLQPDQVLSLINPEWVANASKEYDRALSVEVPASALPAEFIGMFKDFMITAGYYYRNAPLEHHTPLGKGKVLVRGRSWTRIERFPSVFNDLTD